MAGKFDFESILKMEAGTFYGQSGEGHLRLCFGAERYDRIEEAMNRLDRYFRQRPVRQARR
jgi:aspartate aminotransferase